MLKSVITLILSCSFVLSGNAQKNIDTSTEASDRVHIGKYKVFPLRGIYPETPIQIRTTKSYDEIWSRLIQIFAQTDLSVRVSDKNAGLIISNPEKLTATYETKEGKVKDTSAFIVVNKVYTPNNNTIAPAQGYTTLSGELDVRIKQDSGQLIISIALQHIEYTEMSIKKYLLQQLPFDTYKSTGIFETKFANFLLQ